MKQQSFEARYQERWHELEALLEKGDVQSNRNFPKLFRELCHQLSVAKHRRYSPQLVDRLNNLVIECHHRFYEHNSRFHFQWLDFIITGFPAAVRRNRVFVYVATALFLVPLLGMGLTCYLNEEFIFSLASSGDVHEMESMYDPANHKLGRERGTETDIMAFGFYIRNNIGISFRTFAGGIFFGLGSIFFLIFNGLFIGGVGGHLTQLGYGSTFYPFVSGHGSFELTAIVLSGAAGLKLGYAMIHPGNKPWLAALRDAGREAITIIYGTTLMLLIAAFIEAFWSSTAGTPALIKYVVGIVFWVLVLSYFMFSGRRYGSRSY